MPRIRIASFNSPCWEKCFMAKFVVVMEVEATSVKHAEQQIQTAVNMNNKNRTKSFIFAEVKHVEEKKAGIKIIK